MSYKVGDKVPSEYWDDRKNPKYNSLWTEKREGVWFFIEPKKKQNNGNFNLDEYETVKSRKKRFYNDHPDGRIIVEAISNDPLNYSLFRTTLFKNKEDQAQLLALSTGYALEIRDTELKTSKSGNEYTTVNFAFYTENAEESSVGRALDNAGYAGNDKCSKEEMEHVKNVVETIEQIVPNEPAINFDTLPETEF